jgi:hypothetical protein
VPWKVLRTFRIRSGQVQRLSFSPGRRRVYLAVVRTGADRGPQLQERTLPGWRLLHTGTVSRPLNAGPVSAARAALWVTTGGGTTGQVRLFTAGLNHVRLVLGAGELARGREEKHFSIFENNVGAACQR